MNLIKLKKTFSLFFIFIKSLKTTDTIIPSVLFEKTAEFMNISDVAKNIRKSLYFPKFFIWKKTLEQIKIDVQRTNFNFLGEKVHPTFQKLCRLEVFELMKRMPLEYVQGQHEIASLFVCLYIQQYLIGLQNDLQSKYRKQKELIDSATSAIQTDSSSFQDNQINCNQCDQKSESKDTKDVNCSFNMSAEKCVENANLDFDFLNARIEIEKEMKLDEIEVDFKGQFSFYRNITPLLSDDKRIEMFLTVQKVLEKKFMPLILNKFQTYKSILLKVEKYIHKNEIEIDEVFLDTAMNHLLVWYTRDINDLSQMYYVAKKIISTDDLEIIFAFRVVFQILNNQKVQFCLYDELEKEIENFMKEIKIID